jgi:hypothetical protein
MGVHENQLNIKGIQFCPIWPYESILQAANEA